MSLTISQVLLKYGHELNITDSNIGALVDAMERVCWPTPNVKKFAKALSKQGVNVADVMRHFKRNYLLILFTRAPTWNNEERAERLVEACNTDDVGPFHKGVGSLYDSHFLASDYLCFQITHQMEQLQSSRGWFARVFRRSFLSIGEYFRDDITNSLCQINDNAASTLLTYMKEHQLHNLREIRKAMHDPENMRYRTMYALEPLMRLYWLQYMTDAGQF